MNQRKNLLITIGEWWEDRQQQQPASTAIVSNRYSYWLPTPGNVFFTLLVIGSLLWAQNVGAISLGAPTGATTSIAGIPYQGRLADKNGAPLTQTVNMTFRLYAAASGGVPLWEEPWTGANSVQVSDGLFNVMLGSVTPIPQAVITGNSSLFLGITVGTDSEMSPRVQLGSVPFATQALTVPDGSITKAKLANDVVVGLSGWERDESSTTQASVIDQPDLLVQHGYAQHIVTTQDVTNGYFDHGITFPIAYKEGTIPTVVFSSGGESGSANDVLKGGSTNGDGNNTGRIFTINKTSFQIRATGLYVGRRVQFYWTAIGQR